MICEIFADARHKLLITKELEQMAFQNKGHGFWTNPVVEMDVAFNKDIKRCHDLVGSFLGFPFRVEVNPKPNSSEDEIVKTVQALLDRLRQAGVTTVATCDFEDQLL